MTEGARTTAPTRPATLRALAVLFTVCAAVSAQGFGDALVRLRALEVTGLSAFDRDEVAAALVLDTKTVTALKGPLDDKAADLVAARVRELHRRAGYAHAEASANLVGQTVHVALDAGPRFRCGPIECKGNVHVTSADLAARIARRPPVPVFGSDEEKAEARSSAERAWVAGEFATMDERASERAQQLVTDAYRERGRYGVRASVAFVPDGERMTLVVTVEHEGHEVRVRGAKLDGEDAAVAEAVLARTGLAPDSLATTATLASLRRELEATARYVRVDVKVPDDAPAVLEPLVVTVRPRPNSPAVEAVSPLDMEQMRRAFHALAARIERGDALCVEVVETKGGDGVDAPTGRAVWRVGRDGALVRVEQWQLGDSAPTNAAFGLGNAGLLLEYGGRRAACRFAAPWPVHLQLVTAMAPSGEMELRWGFNLSKDVGALLDLTVHPATWRQVLARASSVQREGDILTLRFGETTVRIASDGALLDPELRFAIGTRKFTLSWAADGLAELGRELTTGSTPASFFANVAVMFADALAAEDALVRPLRAGLAAVASELIGDAIAPSSSHSPADRLPSLGEPPMTMLVEPDAMRVFLAKFAPKAAVQRAFDDDGPLVHVCGAFSCALFGDGSAAKVLFDALATDDGFGPLTLAATARLWELLGNERAAATFRRLAADRWSLETCLADADALTASIPVLQPLPALIGARWRTMPELKELLGELPAGASGDLLAWKKGFEHLWNAGDGELLCGVLLSK